MNAPIKATVTLEPRPLYGIGTVARLTGLKSDTLRVWERRYGLGASHKSATGRRQYTQSDLDHLQLVLEPGGAVGLAAVLSGKLNFKSKTIGIIASGGNLDTKKFAKILKFDPHHEKSKSISRL